MSFVLKKDKLRNCCLRNGFDAVLRRDDLKMENSKDFLKLITFDFKQKKTEATLSHPTFLRHSNHHLRHH